MKLKKKLILKIFVVLVIVGLSFLIWHSRRSSVADAKEKLKSGVTYQSSKEQKTEYLERYSELLGLRFPSTTKLLFAYVAKGNLSSPYNCCMKLEIGKEHLEFFIEEINKHSNIKNHALVIGDNSRWYNPFHFDYYPYYLKYYNPDNIWQAKKVKNKTVYTITYNIEYGVPLLCILIDIDNPEKPIVYFNYAEV